MPNKCNVVKCKCNYNKDYSYRVFRLPKDQLERQLWLDVLPPRENFVVNPDKFVIREKHWGADFACFRSTICRTCTSPGKG